MSKVAKYREQGLTTNWLVIDTNVSQSGSAMNYEER